MRITIIGSGYVGLVSGVCFSEFGVDVTCVDNDPTKIDMLNNGQVPIYEPGLEELMVRNRSRLHFTTDTGAAVAQSQVVFIAVGTPERRGDGAADLSYVYQAARNIAPHIKDFTVVVNKSTVPVGTGREVEEIIREENPNAKFAVASNPEFLREGSAIEDFLRPDRIVIGVESEQAAAILKELYRPLYLIETPIVFTNVVTAELTKYAANAFLATKITFINQIANLCEKVGADVHDVAKGMGLDRRIGGKFLHPGPGYGGSCFPKDTLALTRTAQAHGEPITLVENVVAVNLAQKKRMVEKIVQVMDGSVKGATIAVLGLTFKPNTDDMRDSPSLTILPGLLDLGATIRAYDPVGMKEAAKQLPSQVTMCSSAMETVQGADALVILTEWNEFRSLNLSAIFQALKPRADGSRVFCDLRNIYNPARLRDMGFRYVSVGR
ncbi:MAG: UDP-glucose/GDP-mannose dehydrogenase family protein [Magnetococcales bacterium]|nr:UDP-glucose/GDP-mannose dehydrogenase family protein [Magnetococcales bacterium]NGZ27643.1 UDP-glucose/GDP-mannose dehydrogenase family protein [Magnetococcales bacterium]